jgi:hypothetical protein
MVSDGELIRHIINTFDYVRVINASGQPQSVIETCQRLGLNSHFTDILLSYEKTKARPKRLAPLGDSHDKFVDDFEIDLMRLS